MEHEMTAEFVRKVLSQIIDPEVGINIIDLGLVYEVVVSDDASQMRIRMTMTTPACPMSSHLSKEVADAIRHQWPSLEEVDVQLVWEPPWSTDRLSGKAKRQLGWSNP